MQLTTTIDDLHVSLELVGGKALSLSRLTRAGFSVPRGFVVTINAYRHFTDLHGLGPRITELALPVLVNGRASFVDAGAAIRRLFVEHEVDEGAADELRRAYAELGGPGRDVAVAVRSSSNAEDLPELSFAGQQETLLNVRGADAVVDAVKTCWASLWTARALAYRHQHGIAQDSVAMAVIVQEMAPAEASGILFTANPATGERDEVVVNGSFGLGEAVVSGEVTPDTWIVHRGTREVRETAIGAKEHATVPTETGVKLAPVPAERRQQASVSAKTLRELVDVALEVEGLYDGLPQDIEWAVADGQLWLLQSRPITNLPPPPIELDWTPNPPARYLSRRQIVENMPDPVCPLFEELYLTDGLESTRRDKSLMVGGGPMFVTLNGYAYQRFDWPMFFVKDAEGNLRTLHEADIDIAEYEASEMARWRGERGDDERRREQQESAQGDVAMFREHLDAAERAAFDAWREGRDALETALAVVMPESDNPTFTAFNHTAINDRQLQEWHEVTQPRLAATRGKWRCVDPATASDQVLLEGIREMSYEEGYYWSSNASHTFGVAKSTDDQLQTFLGETLPEHNFISGQFLSGIESPAMQANAELFSIARMVRASDELTHAVLTTPSKFLLAALRRREDAGELVAAIDAWLDAYGHQGYSLDFVEPILAESPSAMLEPLKAMVQDPELDPARQRERAAAVRREKLAAITELLDGLPYWQFRFRLWLARRYNHIREQVAFHFGYTWGALRPMAFELGRRMVTAGTFQDPSDTFYLVTAELERAIAARSKDTALPELGQLAAERRQLREARKRHHPPGTIPSEASEIKGISFKETQILNDDDDATMRGFAVSSGRVTAPASVVRSADEFDRMAPGTILVSPLTTPAWTQLFAHAVGLVTDMGSILAHGSIVAREYGIPAVLGVGNGTVRIRHGQTLTIDGDAGTVVLH